MSTSTDISRSLICESGEKLFAKHGYSAVGIKMILDDVGIPKGSFYHYFQSKEAFAVDVVDRFFFKRFEAIERLLEEDVDSLSDAILSIYEFEIDAMFQRKDASGCVIGNLFVEASSDLPMLQKKLQDVFTVWTTVFEALVLRGQKSGEFRDDINKESLTSMFWANWEGTILRFHVNRDKSLFKENLRNFVKLMKNS